MEALRANPYPGRGIVMGFDTQGERGIQVYWVMGRSENSRNRRLVLDGETVRTEPFDPSKVEDPSLIIYNAMRRVGDVDIVTNGDQTDTIAAAVPHGQEFQAIYSRLYEPDAPNFTPRISGIMRTKRDHNGNTVRGTLTFAITSKEPHLDQPHHMTHTPTDSRMFGKGLAVHTYEGDGNPLPSFRQDPYPVLLQGSDGEIAHTYWDILNAENRIALVVKSVNFQTGERQHTIINQLT